MIKVLVIILIVFAVLFLLSLVVYMCNLDMKLASAMIPVMEKIYDRGKTKREKRVEKTENPDRTGTESGSKGRAE